MLLYTVDYASQTPAPHSLAPPGTVPGAAWLVPRITFGAWLSGAMGSQPLSRKVAGVEPTPQWSPKVREIPQWIWKSEH